MPIDRDSPIPLYHQLKQILLEEIEAGSWRPDEVIPTEKNLQDRYELSRTTVRQALNELVAEGYLYRKRGKGTFVARPKVRHGPQRPYGLSGYLRTHGLKPGWRLLAMERTLPPKKALQALELKEQGEVLQIRRLRLADDEAIGVHTVYVPYPLGADVTTEDLTDDDSSSLAYLEERHKVTLSETHRTIEAAPATEEEADLLDVEVGSPVLLVQRTTIGADGQPVEYLKAAYRGDRFEYYVHFEH
jgi:GntR family transcriptional regulator